MLLKQHNKLWLIRFGIILFSLSLALALAQDSVSVTGVSFNFESPQSKLKITTDQEAEFEKTILSSDKQVVIEIKNAKIAKKYTRRLDTSSFKSSVLLVSPYQADSNVRVVLQLKNNANVDVKKSGNEIIALINNDSGEAEVSTTEPKNVEKEKDSETIEAFLRAREQKNYVGKKISLQVKDADIQDVFRIVGEASEFNIILGDDVRGKLTFNLIDVPWDQALDVVLHSQKLAAERHGNILRVTTVDALTKEKEAEAAVKRASEAAEPLVVKIFPISYAKPEELKRILEDFSSKENLGPQFGPAAGGPKRGSIQIDTRTNSLVVRDTPSTIEKIKRIVKELDTQTPQVLIEAKFVEVKESSTKAVQGRVFATSREFDATANQFAFKNKNNFGALFGGGGASELPSSFSLTPVAGASFGFAPRAGLLPGIGEIAAFLSILESEQQAKLVASPRIVTQNKESAEISQGTTIQLPTAAGANAAGSFITVTAVLKLTVTPHVTNDGNITLKINFSQDSPSAQQLSNAGSLSTDTKKVDTSVLIDSGATLVIGGIYSSQLNHSESGIPILRDLPLLGPLFGAKATNIQKGELFIFLTPRVINEKESGLRG